MATRTKSINILEIAEKTKRLIRDAKRTEYILGVAEREIPDRVGEAKRLAEDLMTTGQFCGFAGIPYDNIEIKHSRAVKAAVADYMIRNG